MKKTKFKQVKYVLLCLPMMLITMGSSSCLAETTAQKENQAMKESQSKLIENQPIPQIEWSLERDNIDKRIKLWNDPNKLSYIYLISDNGIIMAFFPIKGKVTNLARYLTPMEQAVYTGAAIGTQLLSAPDELGVYGENGDGIFFFLTDGTYMEWNGQYLLCDEPVKLSQQPLMTYSIQE